MPSYKNLLKLVPQSYWKFPTKILKEEKYDIVPPSQQSKRLSNMQDIEFSGECG